MEYLCSFAQSEEDIVLYHVLHDINKVFWIDVGANDPVRLSVTKFFSLRGGTGINIEPQYEYIEKYKEDRPNEINLAVGVGETKGEMVLHGRGVSASMVSDNKRTSGRKVSIVTLKEICEKYVPDGQDIHILKIDVEGYEKQCLLGMDFSEYHPWVLCIEATEPGTNLECYDRWESIVLEQGYLYALSKGANRYYIHNSHKDLMERFSDTERLHELYSVVNLTKYLKDVIYKDAYEEVVNSRSWRITRPLRYIDKVVKKMRHT